jgi:hypothetical protein
MALWKLDLIIGRVVAGPGARLLIKAALEARRRERRLGGRRLCLAGRHGRVVVGWLGENRCGGAKERQMALAIIPVVTESFLSTCAQAVDAGAAKDIALDLTKGPFNLRYPGRVVFVLLLEGQNVAIFDTRRFLQTLDGRAACWRR